MVRKFSIPPDELARQKMLLKALESAAKREGKLVAQHNGKLTSSSSRNGSTSKPTDDESKPSQDS
jgi:citrate lyase beta subunit